MVIEDNSSATNFSIRPFEELYKKLLFGMKTVCEKVK